MNGIIDNMGTFPGRIQDKLANHDSNDTRDKGDSARDQVKGDGGLSVNADSESMFRGTGKTPAGSRKLLENMEGKLPADGRMRTKLVGGPGCFPCFPHFRLFG